ncbi:MAG: CBS domain-containing protein [Bdellovibrionota bacterium]
MQISEVMQKDIKFANINDSIRKVAELMRNEDIGSVPVLDGEKAVGFVTDRDIVINCVASGHSLDESISDAMTKNVFFVKEDQTLEEASKLMAEKQISRIVVVDRSEKPVGVVGLQDLTQESEDIAEETLSRIKQ